MTSNITASLSFTRAEEHGDVSLYTATLHKLDSVAIDKRLLSETQQGLPPATLAQHLAEVYNITATPTCNAETHQQAFSRTYNTRFFQ